MRMKLKKAIQLIAIIMIGIFMVATVVVFAHKSADRVLAKGPIPPPVGYPKLTLSTMVVTPTLADTDGEVLEYSLEILNTGAYPASDVTLMDIIPSNTIYNEDAQSSALPAPTFKDGVLLWEHGAVGFDDSVAITFSVRVDPGYEGIISNTAMISGPSIAEPVAVMAETRITDRPMFEIAKSATPALPGKNEPLTYELMVTNVGQAADNTTITVTDFVPTNTIFLDAGQDGTYYPDTDGGGVVIWERPVTLETGDTSVFTFSVNFDEGVVSGTVITNDNYLVVGPEDISAGEPYTTTVIDPIFILSKSLTPDPPSSNNEMTYTLTVFNLGSIATDLVITDTVPAEVEYLRGGDSYEDGIVAWHLPSLDTRESAQVAFTGYIADIADIIVLNDDYAVCSAERVCASGLPVPSYIVGPTFKATATLDPIAKEPGAGTGLVTPTLVVENLGPGIALDATALITFGNINVSEEDMVVKATNGTLSPFPCDASFLCWSFVWTGDIPVGELVTFTTAGGQNTVGGDEETHYTATVVITDDLSGYVTEPIIGTAIGHVTQYTNLIPTISAPPQIGAGQTMTYTIQVLDSGLSTDEPPSPVLTETIPAGVTLLSISDGGISETIDGRTTISWTLPAMGPGDYLYRSFAVMTSPDLVSGTLIINDDYRTTWYETELKDTLSNPGEPVTTTVHEVGLIDSYKTVTPSWALPGTGTVLSYVVHVVNSGPNNLSDVQVSDIFPWENATYQRDAAASSGSLNSDLVSLEWTGDVAAYSETLITFTALVDDFFEGVLTNTATITHTSLKQPVDVTTVAYLADRPVLHISRIATPDPVMVGSSLLYQIQVTNLGQQATRLVVSDTIPANTSYISGTASSGGVEKDNGIQWYLPVLDPGETLNLTYRVTVHGGLEIINDSYEVSCDEGVLTYGEPVITRVIYPDQMLLPIMFK